MIVSTYPGKPLAGMEKYKKLYHFTSFDTFVRIWLSKKLKFGSMLEVNDIPKGPIFAMLAAVTAATGK